MHRKANKFFHLIVIKNLTALLKFLFTYIISFGWLIKCPQWLLQNIVRPCPTISPLMGDNSSIEEVAAEDCHWNSGPVSRKQLYEEPKPCAHSMTFSPETVCRWRLLEFLWSSTLLSVQWLLWTGWDNLWNTVIFLYKLVNKNTVTVKKC